MQFRVVIAPQSEPSPNLRLGRLIFIAALRESLHKRAKLPRRIALGISRIDQAVQWSMEVDRTFFVASPVVVLDRLDDIGENLQRRGISAARHAMQHALAGR